MVVSPGRSAPQVGHWRDRAVIRVTVGLAGWVAVSNSRRAAMSRRADTRHQASTDKTISAQDASMAGHR